MLFKTIFSASLVSAAIAEYWPAPEDLRALVPEFD